MVREMRACEGLGRGGLMGMYVHSSASPSSPTE